MRRAELVERIADMNCEHRVNRLKDRPCAQCLGGVTRSLRVVRPEWVERTACKMVQMEGFDCPPTASTYAEALDLLRTVVPMIQGSAARQTGDDHE